MNSFYTISEKKTSPLSPPSTDENLRSLAVSVLELFNKQSHARTFWTDYRFWYGYMVLQNFFFRSSKIGPNFVKRSLVEIFSLLTKWRYRNSKSYLSLVNMVPKIGVSISRSVDQYSLILCFFTWDISIVIARNVYSSLTLRSTQEAMWEDNDWGFWDW